VVRSPVKVRCGHCRRFFNQVHSARTECGVECERQALVDRSVLACECGECVALRRGNEAAEGRT